MAAMSSGRRGMRARGGFTITELLVAMVILLVGIYAVAKGFPSLFRNIDAERQRGEVGPLCEAVLERLKDHPSVLPEAVSGHDPQTGVVIAPDSEPDERAAAPAGNSRDDLIEVTGEVLRVPGPADQASPSVYPLNLGPAGVAAGGSPLLSARELVELERLRQSDFAALPGGVIPAGASCFYLDSVGQLFLPTDLTAALVDYCWVDGAGGLHYAHGEYVPSGGAVRAAGIGAAPAFAAVVQGSCRATGTIEYNVVLGDASAVAPGTCVLEQNYGATLLFDPSAMGTVVQVDYTLRAEPDANGNPRRALMVMEEFTAPTTTPYQADLKFAGIDDENPLYATALDGTDIPDAYLLTVDLQTGDIYTDADPEVQLDMARGKATFMWPSAAGMSGHELRVYYRTLDGHCVQAQKAPQYFVEDRLAAQYTGAAAAGVDYRTYSPSADTGDPNYTVLTFPQSAAGQAVAVDYLWDVDGDGVAPFERACGELHVIDAQTGTIVLGNPSVQAIVGVQGVSLKVRGWWHTQRGRLVKLDLDTFLTPKKLL